MSIKVTINRSGSLTDKFLERAMTLAHKKGLEIAKQRLAGISCPEHGTIPEPLLEPQSDGYHIRVSNICCPAFEEIVRARLKGESAE